MAEVGSLWVRLRGDTAGFDKAMAGVSKQLKATGDRMKDVGQGMSTNVTLPILAIGAGAIAAATQVEDAMATIRAGTGATGEDLAKLGEDFRAVFKRVPESAGEVSTAIADLNTRLGLSGEPLQQLTEQMLGLADLTGTQIAPLIASTTRVFGDWSVATADQSKTLDTLFKVSQSTGIGVDKLSDSLVQFGAPLRQMGFDLTESAALMGSWEKEGVNMEMVLGSLRIAMGEFARAGIPMRQGLDETMKRIKELGPGAEATALAMDIFGARAGPDMAAAILEGRFAVEELLAQIEASPETILAADAATETFAERMAVLRNQVTLAVEPIGVRLMDALMKIMPQVTALIDKIAGLAEKFANLSPQTQTTILKVVGLVAALGPLLSIIGTIITVFGSVVVVLGKVKIALVATKGFLLGTGAVAGGAAAKVGILSAALTFLKAKLLPLKVAFLAITAKVWIVIAVIAALAAGVYLVIKNWDAVTVFFANLWESAKKIFADAWEWIKDMFFRYHPIGLVITHWEKIKDFFAGLWESIKQIFVTTWEWIKDMFLRYHPIGLIITHWQTITTFFTTLWATVTSIFTTAWTTIRAAVQSGWAAIHGIFNGMVGSIRNALLGIVDAITSPFRRAQEVVSGITRTIANALQRINPFARSSPSLVDNVRAGVRAISAEYAKLENLQLPAVGAMIPQAAVASAATHMMAGTTYHGPLFTVQNMTVRSDADIENISRQLYRHIQSGAMARG